jgi:phosphatidate cytidylyltransferase
MLRLRVITALIAAPAVIAAIFLLPPLAFASVFLVLSALGLYEWANLARVSGRVATTSYLVGFAALGWVLLGVPDLWRYVFAVVVVFWLIAAIIVLTYPSSGRLLAPVALVPAGYVVIGGAWLALVALVAGAGGAWVILWLFVVVWSTDIGAYFCGRRFGRRKLAVHVSPGKTWEGAFGGVLLATVIGTAVGMTVPALSAVATHALYWAGGALVVAVISVFGDLFESALKRESGTKDSGALFPGHGGMLDRIDSLLATLPCVAFVVGNGS